MDMFPDWLGETGGVPYPVLVQGLDLSVSPEMLELLVEEPDVSLMLALDTPTIVVEMGTEIGLAVESGEIDLEVDGG